MASPAERCFILSIMYIQEIIIIKFHEAFLAGQALNLTKKMNAKSLFPGLNKYYCRVDLNKKIGLNTADSLE
jgi:hypothetical protein